MILFQLGGQDLSPSTEVTTGEGRQRRWVGGFGDWMVEFGKRRSEKVIKASKRYIMWDQSGKESVLVKF